MPKTVKSKADRVTERETAKETQGERERERVKERERERERERDNLILIQGRGSTSREASVD